MPRYIDAELLMQKLSRMIDYCEKNPRVNGLTALFQAGDAVMDCPTADVVEVVRCKDCVNRVEFDTNKFHCEITGYYCGETRYCSDGVRKTE